ncbi:hypothetical protein L1887_49112 [Cichorium endivia]|nr:hypothetical protein L1887_49112 [Cichorium endivia]
MVGACLVEDNDRSRGRTKSCLVCDVRATGSCTAWTRSWWWGPKKEARLRCAFPFGFGEIDLAGACQECVSKLGTGAVAALESGSKFLVGASEQACGAALATLPQPHCREAGCRSYFQRRLQRLEEAAVRLCIIGIAPNHVSQATRSQPCSSHISAPS